MVPQQLDEAAIFDIARRIPAGAVRADYIQQACGNNTALLARVNALLEALDNEPRFMDAPPSAVDATRQLASVDERPGTVIGKFKLMEQIGEGGFGVVYVAEQEKPVRRKVALKVIKPGMDTKEVIARFEAERQALALMDHPNIAKVLDAGSTDSGRPYFVMELVRGIPITEYCDRKKLRTRKRLELFVSVCQAMQHAHQKGVIHRDVKPTNVLITEHDGTPLPKVIDFGVAKATNQRLTERTIYTRHQQMVGTPLYMSPEQAELSALDVDTRTDIYSLGVLLYELLTGTTPYDRKRFSEAAYDEIRRIIREEDPPKPSTRISTLGVESGTVTEFRSTDIKRLSNLLRGELDWIVMKALEKDRGRRYETASAFAEDVKRHLANEPVLAGPPSTVYRLRKFVYRRRAVVATACAITTAIVLGFSAAVAGFLDANDKRRLAEAAERRAEAKSIEAEQERDTADEERRRAEAEVEKVNKVLTLMKDMLRSGTPWMKVTENSSDPQYTVRQMLVDFSERLEEDFDDDPDVGAEIWLTVGHSIHDLGDLPRAKAAFQRAIELKRKSLAGDDRRLAGYLWATGLGLTDPGNFEEGHLRAGEAEALFREAVELFERVGWGSDTSTTPFLVKAALGGVVAMQGRFQEAEAILLEALAENEAPAAAQNNLAAWAHQLLSWCLWYSDKERVDEAIQHADQALALTTGGVYNWALLSKANCLLDQHRMMEANLCYEELLELRRDDRVGGMTVLAVNDRMRALLALDRKSEAKRELEELRDLCRDQNKWAAVAYTLRHLADIAVCEGTLEQAEDYLAEAAAAAFASFGPHRIMTVKAQMDLARYYRLTGSLSEADEIYKKALPHVERAVRDTDRHSLWLTELAKLKSLSTVSSQDAVREAVHLAQTALATAPRPDRNAIQYTLANAHARLGYFRQAISVLNTGLDDRHMFLISEWLPLEQLLEQLLREHGTPSEVEDSLRDNIAYRESILPATHPATLEAKVRLVDWLVEQKRPADAITLLTDCEALARHEDTTDQRRRLAKNALIHAYTALERPDKAAQWSAAVKQASSDTSSDSQATRE